MDRMIQPPLVDTTACLCRVDAGLKTVAGAKRYVPGTKLCLQPDIKPSIHPTRSKATRGDRSRNQSPLLPGLPDDLAIACLIRVPRVEHRKLRLVCKRWYRLLSGNFFYSLRKSLGIAEEWIYVIKRDRDGKISWHAFDPVYQLWQPLPPVPKEYSEALGFGCAVLSGCHLYLFGGKDPLKGSMRRVIFYSARTNKWHRAPDMLRRRHFFGSCVINNCLYVAGGENEGVHRSLRSAEVYDPNKNRWSYISDMSTAMVPFIGVVYEGKWFLKGLGPHQQVMSEVYQPETDNWYPVYNGMVAGWRNPCTSLNGHLYALECKDGCKLRVYDEVTDSWGKHIDSRIHLGPSGVDERTLKREGVCAASLPTTMGVVAGLLVQNTLKFLLGFGHVSPYLGYSSLKDFFPTMTMKPNPQCSNAACLERQKEYILAKPARDAAAKAKMEAEAAAATAAGDMPLHVDNEWNISVVDDNEPAKSTCGTSSDALPEGLTRELPSADEFQKPQASGATDSAIDDLEDLRRQLEALNAA